MIKHFLFILVVNIPLHGMEKEPEYYFDLIPRELKAELRAYLHAADPRFVCGHNLLDHSLFYNDHRNPMLLRFFLDVIDLKTRVIVRSAFVRAIQSGDTPYIDEYIKAGIDIKYLEQESCPLLIIATEFNKVEIVKKLLAAGADMDKTTGNFCQNCKYVSNDCDYVPSYRGPREFKKICYDHQVITAPDLAKMRGYQEITKLFEECKN